jgi:hypothetical protein
VLALRSRALAAAGVLVVIAPGAEACKPKASGAQCDQLLERYATLRVREKMPDASAAEQHVEEQNEKAEARGDDAFKNCTSEVSQTELDCAMRAPNAAAFEKCLE